MNSPSLAQSSAIISFLLLTMLSLASSAGPLRLVGCTKELIAFSPCLPYVSSPPNNGTSSASSQCCRVFSSAFESGDGSCLCYLVRQPLILGFPLNATRLLALSSICLSRNAISAINASLETFCLGLRSLPPFQGTTGQGLGQRPATASDSVPTYSPPPSLHLPPEPPEHSPTLSSSQPSSTAQTKKMNLIRILFQQGIIIVIVLI